MHVLFAALLLVASALALQGDPPAPLIPQQFRAISVSTELNVLYFDSPNQKARIDVLKEPLVKNDNGTWKLEIQAQTLYRYDRGLKYTIEQSENKTWDCNVTTLEGGVPAFPNVQNATYIGERACENSLIPHLELGQCYYWSGVDPMYGAYNYSDTVQGRQASWFSSPSRSINVVFVEVISGPITSLNFVAPGNCVGIIS